MGAFEWLLRCTPGLSLIVLLLFLETTLAPLRNSWNEITRSSNTSTIIGGPVFLYSFAVYSIVLHILAWAFGIRLCCACWHATQKIRELHREVEDEDELTRVNTPESDSGTKSIVGMHVDETSLEKVPVIMAIIIPSYKEDISTMEDTLNILASHPLARASYDIFLAMEERDPKGATQAQQLISSFEERFHLMRYTVHPTNIPGEVSGKSSNVNWASKDVERTYSGTADWKNVLITIMDSDTHLMPQYFHHLRQAHYRNRKSGYMTDMTLYMPPIIFDRNAHSVPRMVRVADLMWCGAGLSCFMYKASPNGVAIPTAVYTIPLALANLVNGWDTGPGAIGEDMHMMLKCYFATNGRMQIESIPSPASQCNIEVDTKGIRGWLDHHSARYSQGLRHMWGCLDTGFAMSKWFAMGQKQPAQPVANHDEKTAIRRTRKLSHTELSLKLSQYALHGCEPRRFTYRNLTVFSRLFEAHFLPAHLFIILIASSVCAPMVQASTDLYWIDLALDFTGYLRFLSYATMLVFFFILYERYHHTCVQLREREMMKAGLHEQLQGQFSRRGRWNVWHWIDYIVFPIAGTLFGSVCLFQAAFSHFFTDQLVYLVSAKPVRVLLNTATLTKPSNPLSRDSSPVSSSPMSREKELVSKEV